MSTAFACHENGGTSLLYASQHQLLISAGRKGDVCMWDLRQRTLRHKFTAHESSVAVKCMALDPNEEFFITGSADGDIKVCFHQSGLDKCQLVQTLLFDGRSGVLLLSTLCLLSLLNIHVHPSFGQWGKATALARYKYFLSFHVYNAIADFPQFVYCR